MFTENVRTVFSFLDIFQIPFCVGAWSGDTREFLLKLPLDARVGGVPALTRAIALKFQDAESSLFVSELSRLVAVYSQQIHNIIKLISSPVLLGTELWSTLY